MEALLHMVRIDGEILWCSARLPTQKPPQRQWSPLCRGPGWRHCTATARSGHIVANVQGNAADHIDLDEIEARPFRGSMGQHGLCRTKILTIVQCQVRHVLLLGRGCADGHVGCGKVRLTSEPSLSVAIFE